MYYQYYYYYNYYHYCYYFHTSIAAALSVRENSGGMLHTMAMQSSFR